jgi:hypothetical protein
LSSSLDRRTTESKWLSRVSTASAPGGAIPVGRARPARKGCGDEGRGRTHAHRYSREAHAHRLRPSDLELQDLELANGFTTALLEHSSTEVL